jgi:hypothetical protein
MKGKTGISVKHGTRNRSFFAYAYLFDFRERIGVMILMPYDTAQICLNGHVINASSTRYSQFNRKHCPDCGKPTITKCPNCGENIRGRYINSASLVPIKFFAPKFCDDCGNAFPWTENALSAAKELADELDTLSAEEREDLKSNIEDIVKDTPRTTVAAQKVKQLIEKAGSNVPAMFKAILIDFAVQAATHQLGWH